MRWSWRERAVRRRAQAVLSAGDDIVGLAELTTGGWWALGGAALVLVPRDDDEPVESVALAGVQVRLHESATGVHATVQPRDGQPCIGTFGRPNAVTEALQAYR